MSKTGKIFVHLEIYWFEHLGKFRLFFHCLRHRALLFQSAIIYMYSELLAH